MTCTGDELERASEVNKQKICPAPSQECVLVTADSPNVQPKLPYRLESGSITALVSQLSRWVHLLATTRELCLRFWSEAPATTSQEIGCLTRSTNIGTRTCPMILVILCPVYLGYLEYLGSLLQVDRLLLLAHTLLHIETWTMSGYLKGQHRL